ncbi:RNA-binding domain-containing protein [Agromyces archimandritae]|uniref:DNA binding domain-containing protein n=1 Tax=Agromyces archimandritae TaxID=2781962 RepID=A0A975FND1_9MICO|nr:RNA-binding domain-containing protein [Agromyces archimandritae]QTX05643.1 putative DNA binding domain-containing protein [Agromyces archimandritae]
MTPDELAELTAGGETLKLEFKSEAHGKLSDSTIVEVVVCLANGEGGTLLIGVEDDGRITGAKPHHKPSTDPLRLQAYISNNTVPPLVTQAEVVVVDEAREVIRIEVPNAESIVGTRQGLYVRRGFGADGRPACLPLLAHEMLAERISRGETDFARLREPTAGMSDLDPAEFERFRRLAARAGRASAGLAALSNEDLLSSLEVAERDGSRLILRRGALLLFGRSESIRRYIPTHETAFRVLSGNTGRSVENVDPLFKTAEGLFEDLRPHNSEADITVGLLRVTIDRIPEIVARELIANALVHRDYTVRGTVAVQLSDDELRVSSPGGFPRGTTLQNFLEVSNPRSRILADAFKHAGLVERNGNGINRVFEAELRSGRPEPDYSGTDGNQVVVSVQLGGSDIPLVRFVIEHDERTGRAFDLADLQVVRSLKDDPKQSLTELSGLLQRPITQTRTRLTRLLEEGVVEMRGNGRARRYLLSSSTYRKLASDAGYVRVRAFDEPQQAQMILNYVDANGSISRSEAAELCGTSPEEARRILLRLRDEGELRLIGERRTSRYVRA